MCSNQFGLFILKKLNTLSILKLVILRQKIINLFTESVSMKLLWGNDKFILIIRTPVYLQIQSHLPNCQKYKVFRFKPNCNDLI